ncbi:MAG: sulfurtransferase [Candidatus Sericytochromatia bacterium]|nr:sulfurtransferase [Candidatus Sericytochromatia bacterium]
MMTKRHVTRRCGGLIVASGLTVILGMTVPVLAATAATPGFAQPDLVVSAAWLKTHLSSPDLIVVDARSAEAYAQGHIPRAISLPLTQLLTDPTETAATTVARLTAVVSASGIGTHKRVILYDKGGDTAAPRLFWTLELLGRSQVAVLDGGLQGWQSVAGGMTTVPTRIGASPFQTKVELGRLQTMAGCIVALGDPHSVVVDTRSAAEHAGSDVRAARGGHMPGAVNIDWQTNFDGPRLGDPERLRTLYLRKGVTPDRTVISHCQSGSRAAVTYWVLRLLGYPNVKNYAGSWAEWGNDPTTPVVTGT